MNFCLLLGSVLTCSKRCCSFEAGPRLFLIDWPPSSLNKLSIVTPNKLASNELIGDIHNKNHLNQ